MVCENRYVRSTESSWSTANNDIWRYEHWFVRQSWCSLTQITWFWLAQIAQRPKQAVKEMMWAMVYSAWILTISSVSNAKRKTLAFSQQQSLPNSSSNKYHRNKATLVLDSNNGIECPTPPATSEQRRNRRCGFAGSKNIIHTQGIFIFDQANIMGREAHDELMAARGRY